MTGERRGPSEKELGLEKQPTPPVEGSEKKPRRGGVRKQPETKFFIPGRDEEGKMVTSSELEKEVDELLEREGSELSVESKTTLKERFYQGIDRAVFENKSQNAEERRAIKSALISSKIGSFAEKIRSAVRNLKEQEARLIPELFTKYQMGEVYRQTLKELSENKKIIFVSIDLDDFKKVNDTQGTVAGDGVLRSFGTALSKAVHRPDDAVVHFSGDEFGLMLVVDNTADPQKIVSRILKDAQVERPTADGNRVEIQEISAGYVVITPENIEDNSFTRVREMADAAKSSSVMVRMYAERNGEYVPSYERAVNHSERDVVDEGRSSLDKRIGRATRGLKREIGSLVDPENPVNTTYSNS